MDRGTGLKLTPAELAAPFVDSLWGKKFSPVLTVDEAAELLRVPKSTIYDWSSRGMLRGSARRVGKHLRIFRDRLLRQVFNEGLIEQ